MSDDKKMTISEYITALESLKAAHGDLPVVRNQPYGVLGAFCFSGGPRLVQEAKLLAREKSRRLMSTLDGPNRASGVFYVEVL